MHQNEEIIAPYPEYNPIPFVISMIINDIYPFISFYLAAFE